MSETRFFNKSGNYATIIYIDEDRMRFSNGKEITYDHGQDCCEWNYADFKAIADEVRGLIFDMRDLQFEAVENYGFRFGNENQMIFVPCYSEQNGYYSSDLEIYLDGEKVLYINCCEEVYV